MRVACVLLSHFAVVVERRDRPELRRVPVVIGGLPGERKAVHDCSSEARRAGVRPGMPLRQALALCRDAVFVDPRATLYAEVWTAILDALGRFSPQVAAPESGCALLRLNGTERLWRDEQALATSLQDAVRSASKLVPRVSIADGVFAARAAALTAPTAGVLVIPPGATLPFLSDLPIDHLPVSESMIARLHRLGLHTLGALAALPAGAVQAQFGREGRIAWGLAHGIEEVHLPVRTPATSPQEWVEMPAPTADRAALEQGVRLGLRRLFRRSDVGGRTARRLTFAITLEDGRTWERTVTFREPTADVDAVLFVLRTHLDRLDLPAAATAVVLRLHDLGGEHGRQERLFTDTARLLPQVGEAIRQLDARLGTATILRLVEVEPHSRIPERRMALTEYLP
jgi:nucleotidyltransferase/DNA polymerase involved in DNA repair